MDSVDGQHCPLKTYGGVFIKGVENPLDVTRHLFLMNMKTQRYVER